MSPTFRVPNARPGDNILAAVEALAQEERSAACRPSADMQLVQTPAGSTYRYQPPSVIWRHPWRPVMAGPRSIAVAVGRVNGIMATINGVPLSDGPLLIIDEKDEPDEELETWGCVQVKCDPVTGLMIDPKKNPDAVSIVHMTALNDRYKDGITPDKNNLGIQPVFIIIWKDAKTIDRVDPYAVHHLKHEFLKPDPKRRGRHFFSGDGV